MAKITLDLNQFKASGVYTVEFDATESVVLNTQTIRLVVGFSKRGPINAPVFLRDIKSARKVFGVIDTSLEKNGSFFQRSIETALQTGPIYALNLRALDNRPEGDMVEFQALSLDTAEQNPPEANDLLVSFYNTERFWRPERDYFKAVVNNNYASKGNLMAFVNLNTGPMSVFVQKSSIKGFDMPAREYYGQGNVPGFIRPFDYISDYFLEVTMVSGDWTDYTSLSLDPVYQQWFDKNGLKKDQFENFLSAEETTTIGTFVGTIIPDFVDGNGVNQYLETIINNAFGATGIYMMIDRDTLEDNYDQATSLVDLIGHNLIDTTNSSINFISYVTPISEVITGDSIELDEKTITFETDTPPINEDMYIKSVPYGDDRGYFNNVLVIKKPAPNDLEFTVEQYDILAEEITPNTILKTAGSKPGFNDYVKVETFINTGTELHITFSHPEKNKITINNSNHSNIGKFIVSDVSSAVGSPGSMQTLSFESSEGISPQQLNTGDLLYSPDNNEYYIAAEHAIFFPSGNGSVKLIKLNELNVSDPNYLKKWLDPEDGKFEGNKIDLVGKEVYYMVDVARLNNLAYTVDFDSYSNPVVKYVLEPALIIDDLVDPSDNFTKVYPNNPIAVQLKNNVIIDGDRLYADATGTDIWWISVKETNVAYGLPGFEVRQYMDEDLVTQANDIEFVQTGHYYFSNGLQGSPLQDALIYYSSYGNIEKNVDIVDMTLAGSRLEFKIGAADATDIEVGQFLVTEDLPDNPSHLTTVIDKIKSINQFTGDIEYMIKTNERIKVTTSGSPSVQSVTRYLPVDEFVHHLQPSALSGFKITRFHIPDGSVSQQEKIYNVINETGLRGALADKDQIQFRYIIDTFQGAIAPNMGPKVVLTSLAKARQQCMAFINAPSVKQLSESTDPRFTDSPDPQHGFPKPVFKSYYIPHGGNLSLGPSFKLTLPTESQGSKYMGVFSPNLLVRENNKNLSIPPAAYISNNFVEKFINGVPYSITAGPRRGIISTPNLVGVEYEYDMKDREQLEPYGWNPVIITRNTGPMIYSNSTAFQKFRSAMNNLHVRDLLITVEENIEEILSFYVWEFNDARTRLEIKTLVDRYLSVVQNGAGIYDYLTIMDETNNTPEVIDQNVGIIDVGIEPARGLQKIINRITVLKTGTISSGGFTIA